MLVIPSDERSETSRHRLIQTDVTTVTVDVSNALR